MNTLHWKMNLRRHRSNLLTALLIAISTVFLLLYPGFITNAQAELDTAYKEIEVSGWLLNASGYEDPSIPYRTCKTLLDTGFIKQYYAYSQVNFSMPDEALEKLGAEPDNAGKSREELLDVLAGRLKNIALGNPGVLYGVNDADAETTLRRLQSGITWLDGYSAVDLAGDEAICVLSKASGLALGEEATLILRRAEDGSEREADELRRMERFKVVGLYELNMGSSSSDAPAYCPLETMRQLLSSDLRWQFCIRSFSFTLQNNRELPRFKEILVGLRLDRDNFVRAAIDDRILQGTVAPIQKNIDLLTGLHAFLYALVALLGFFLCFLLSRARKPEYAVMRMLGENRLQVTGKALLEQAALCVVGVGLGIIATLLISGETRLSWTAAGMIAMCYCAGAAIAVLMSVRVDVMTILRDKE